jgi:hypothetical protein
MQRRPSFRLSILFISPSSYDSRGNLIKSRKGMVAPRTMLYLAALTPPQFELLVIDELVENIPLEKKSILSL